MSWSNCGSSSYNSFSASKHWGIKLLFTHTTHVQGNNKQSIEGLSIHQTTYHCCLHLSLMSLRTWSSSFHWSCIGVAPNMNMWTIGRIFSNSRHSIVWTLKPINVYSTFPMLNLDVIEKLIITLHDAQVCHHLDS